MKVLPCFMLYILLAAGTSLAVDVNWLTEVMRAIRNEYKIDGQFCLAANIPLQRDTNTLNEILRDNRYENTVRPVIGERDDTNRRVYESNRVVIARFLYSEHAEYRVLQKLQRLRENSAGNFLLIYSYLSPCIKCANIHDPHNILKLIENHIQNWTDGAFVFTKVYDQSNSEVNVTTHATVDRAELTDSLLQLGVAMGDYRDIFRCDGQRNSELECHSCSADSTVSESCIANNAWPPQAGIIGTNIQ